MITNYLPVETTHSSLDLFEKAPLLVTFDGSFEQRIGPAYSVTGPVIEFEVVGDRNNFIDLQKIYLQVKCKILLAGGTGIAETDSPSHINNLLHSLFSDCCVYANGIKISSTNGLYAHKSYIETEFSHGKEAKDTWLACQGYSYESNPNDVSSAAFLNRQIKSKQSAEITLYGKIAADIFSCEKHLLSGVTLRLSFIRSQDVFTLMIPTTDDKKYKIQIVDANLFVRKMTVSDNVLTAIEKVLTKTPAQYRYIETIPKSFLAGMGQRSWKQEDVFNKQPIRRFAIAMNTNNAFTGHSNLNPFHYQKFDLSEVVVYRNGTPVAGTPLDTTDSNHIYFKTVGALSFNQHGHGISLGDYEKHFIMVFDLTSTQEANSELIYPELTNASISVEMRFKIALPFNVEILMIGEKASTLYIDSARRVSKNVLMGV